MENLEGGDDGVDGASFRSLSRSSMIFSQSGSLLLSHASLSGNSLKNSLKISSKLVSNTESSNWGESFWNSSKIESLLFYLWCMFYSITVFLWGIVIININCIVILSLILVLVSFFISIVITIIFRFVIGFSECYTSISSVLSGLFSIVLTVSLSFTSFIISLFLSSGHSHIHCPHCCYRVSYCDPHHLHWLHHDSQFYFRH